MIADHQGTAPSPGVLGGAFLVKGFTLEKDPLKGNGGEDGQQTEKFVDHMGRQKSVVFFCHTHFRDDLGKGERQAKGNSRGDHHHQRQIGNVGLL